MMSCLALRCRYHAYFGKATCDENCDDNASMTDQTLKLVFVPWGADSFGEDVWLFENGITFCLELLLESIQPEGSAQYADLYGQLGGDDLRVRPVKALAEADLMHLADRVPAGTDGIVDGMLSVDSSTETGALSRVVVAPRVTFLPSRRIEAPEAFVFEHFDSNAVPGGLNVSDPAAFFHLAFAVGLNVLALFGMELPPSVGPEKLQITENWPAFVLFLKGKRLAKTSDEKLGYYRQAVKLDPSFYWAHYNAGQLLKQAEDYPSARRSFLACSRSAGQDSALLGDAFFELGLCSIYLGDTKTARSFWDEALQYAPDNATLLVNVGGTYEQEEDWQRAMALHERALEIEPNYHKAIVSLARLNAAVGQLDRAIPLYHRALELQPNDALREAILGGCYLADGKPNAAVEHLRRASEMDPPRPNTRKIDDDEPAAPGEYARAELQKLKITY